jgi:hypothetical protein
MRDDNHRAEDFLAAGNEAVGLNRHNAVGCGGAIANLNQEQ